MVTSGLMHYVNAAIILIAASFYLGGGGLLFPAATTGAIEPFGHLAGTAGAVLGGVQNIGAGVATMISACIPQFSQLPMGAILLALAILMAVSFFCLINKPLETST